MLYHPGGTSSFTTAFSLAQQHCPPIYPTHTCTPTFLPPWPRAPPALAVCPGALEAMQQSSAQAATILRAAGCTACTDVTGFGLVGHAVEMARACEHKVGRSGVAAWDKRGALLGVHSCARALLLAACSAV